MQLEEAFEEERRALLVKYQKLEKPLNLSRRALVVNEDNTVGIKDFWLTVFSNCSFIMETMIVGDKDPEALSFLRDVRCNLLEDARSFKFEFEFAENPYFEDSILNKVYRIDEDGDPIGAEGHAINWKKGKNLTVKLKKKKKTGKGRPAVTKTEPCETFFNWFTPPQVPEDMEAAEDMDEQAQEELEEALEEDFDQGMTLKDKIVPHAVMWFVGEAEDSDMEEDSDEDSDMDSDMDSDDDDEEDDMPPPKGGRGGRNKGSKGGRSGPPAGTFGGEAAAPGEEQADCKQQ